MGILKREVSGTGTIEVTAFGTKPLPWVGPGILALLPVFLGYQNVFLASTGGAGKTYVLLDPEEFQHSQ